MGLSAASIQDQLHEAMMKLADGKEAHVATAETLASLQDEWEAGKHELAVERRACKAATQVVGELQTDLQVARQAAASFQSQLAVFQQEVAAQEQACQAAKQQTASLQMHLLDTQQELRAEQQSCFNANRLLSDLQGKFAAAEQTASFLGTHLEGSPPASQKATALHIQMEAPQQDVADGKQGHSSAIASFPTTVDPELLMDLDSCAPKPLQQVSTSDCEVVSGLIHVCPCCVFD